MRESKPQRAVASHGDAADGATASPSVDTVFGFDERDELLQKKIAVAGCAVGGIDVEGASAFRSDNQKLSYLVLLPKIIKQRPSAAVKQRALIVAEAVQEIEDWVCLGRMLGCTGVVAGGKVDAVVDRMFQDPAV